MIRGVGNELMNEKTDFIGLDFYKPRDRQSYMYTLDCTDLRIVQRNRVCYENNYTRLSWDFPNIKLRLDGHVPSNIESLAISLHWRNADAFKAAYSLNKGDEMTVEIYFGNMSENDRKNRMIRNTITFSPKISLPKSKKDKYLHLTVDETLPFDSLGSIITINRKYGTFWDESWLKEKEY